MPTDHLCSVELADLRFMDNDASATCERIYGTRRMFRTNYLKRARRKRLDRCPLVKTSMFVAIRGDIEGTFATRT